MGVRERSPYPGLQLEAGQAFIQGRNKSQILDHVLLLAVNGEVNAPGIVQDGAVAVVGKVGFALIKPAMNGQIILGRAARLLVRWPRRAAAARRLRRAA